ncbi:MAG: DUF547 domain-containing protein [Planctomycetota bacterium]|jgi:hypothetical protein
MRTLLVLLLFAGLAAAGPSRYADLLRAVVGPEGVDRAELLRRAADVDRIVEEFRKAEPGATRADRLAFWINTHNAVALQRLVAGPDHAAATQERGGLTPAGIVELLREGFHDPRVLFALHGPATSSPALASVPYRAATLDESLTQAVRAYLADTRHNRFDEARLKAEISEIFQRYKLDFAADVKDPSPRVPALQQWLARYAPSESLRRRLLSSRWTFRYRPWNVAPEPPPEGGPTSLLFLYLAVALALLGWGVYSLRSVRK